MAQSKVTSLPPRLSFAEIAARPAPRTNVAHTNTQKDHTQAKTNNAENSRNIEAHSKSPSLATAVSPTIQLAKPDDTPTSTTTATTTTSFIEGLSLVNKPAEDRYSPKNVDSGDSYEEDHSQVSSSSLNKPHSFDTKSLASVTTFAMDDKESIRPDDSASVRAVEDDHPHHPELSRNSSYHHENDYTNSRSLKLHPVSVVIPGRRFPTLANPPRFGNLPISPVLETSDIADSERPSVPVPSADEPRAVTTTISITPDEKLLDALTSPKDRLPLLQLEEKFVAFVLDHSRDTLDFPPQNPFARLLTHKLADYYSLAHHVSEDNSSVRVIRTGYGAMPPSLAELAKAIPLGASGSTNAIAVKIMRREHVGRRPFSAGNSTAPSSSVPSKATSETGAETNSDEGLMSPIENTPSRDKSKMTREEREAQYKAARERIFRDFQESNVIESAVSTGENSATLSRSSSTSGKKKTAKRHKQPRDDSFDPRSAFVPNFVPSQSFYGGSFVDSSLAESYPASSEGFDQSMYGATPTQSCYSYDMAVPHVQAQQEFMSTSSMHDWQPQSAQQNGFLMYPNVPMYNPNQATALMSPGIQLMPPMDPAQHIPHGAPWYPTQHYQTYCPQMPMVTDNAYFPQPTTNNHNGLSQIQSYNSMAPPSAFAQQNNRYSPVDRNQRSLFNPQTRSFVPGSNIGRGGKFNKHKNNSRGGNSVPYSSVPSSNNGITSVGKEDTLKQKYGTPSSLPKKPPPPEVKPSVEPNLPVSIVSNRSTSESSNPATVNGTNI